MIKHRWFAKRFLHPDVVAEFEYIFIWDEDLGVDNFTSEEYVELIFSLNSILSVFYYYGVVKYGICKCMFCGISHVKFFMIFRYIKIVKKHGLEISQPAITSSSDPTYKITMKRNNVEVHKYVFGI